jgi:DNA-binding LacI/PurR family transcriptional regulator
VTASAKAVPIHAPVMADVARLAGVSHQTVSRVINDHPSVTAETRARVKLAIVQLGYRRNTAARTLVTRQSRIFGVISVDTSHFGPASTIFAVAEAARTGGYFLNFVSLREIDRAQMTTALSHLMDAGVDGIVVIAPVNAAVESLRGLHPDLPVVVVAASQLESLTIVAVDQVAGARLATRHLLDLGHRTVVHVSGPDDWVDATARVKGWRTELAAAGRIAYDLIPGDWSADSGYQAGQILLARMRSGQQDVTAVFAANDQMSLGLIRALHEAGVRVPEDISIVGFDDIPEAGHFLPPLTTVKQDFGAIGRRCVEMLIDTLNNRQAQPSEPIQPALIVRASTSPPPHRRAPAGR